MQVISTNLGEKKKVIYRGKEVYTGIFKYPVNEPLHLGKTDVEKDKVIDRRFHGGVDKACYLYSADHYAYWKGKYPDLDWDWGMFGENLTVKALDESNIHIGDVFKIGTATVQATQPRQPCFKFGIRMGNPLAVKEFIAAQMPGVYIRVLEEGSVKTGDRLEVIEQKLENKSIKEIFYLLYNAKENVEEVKNAVQIPELAQSCYNDLIKMARLDAK